jgi:uncharacterized protein (TIGR03435 family)
MHHRWRHRAATIALSACGSVLLTAGQADLAGRQPVFEIASIKLNTSGERRATMDTPPGGRFTATNIPARAMIAYAYNIQERQVVGGPPWLDKDRFDVEAKGTATSPAALTPNGAPTPTRQMLRSLLAERFSLATHNEERDAPVYHLVLNEPTRGLGPRIHRTSADCSDARPCRINLTLGALNADGRSLTQLGNILSQFVQRPVFDRTGIPGMFAIDLTWTPEQIGNAPVDALPPTDLDRPGLFTAVQEQLGLRLQPARGPLPTLVIDHAERPSPN